MKCSHASASSAIEYTRYVTHAYATSIAFIASLGTLHSP